MSLAEPPKESLEGVEWEALRAISDHAGDLSRQGPIDPHVFRALWDAGLKATRGQAELLETLRMFAPEGFEP